MEIDKQDEKLGLNTPVLFMVFNRMDTTQKVFEEISRVRPQRLFIASDGPRENKLGEKEKVEEIRNYLLKGITWKCEVKTLFREKNLGCKYAVSSAITWFFENVEQGIIIEDDCLPSQSFFRFCEEILEKYKGDEKIMQISGTNIESNSEIKESYFFSNNYNIWGWASWKRAWKKYDVEMNDWKKWRIKILKLMKNYSLIEKIKSIRLYELTYKKKIDTWDYQWDFICRINSGLSIIPEKNLVTNLGFSEGTHTTNYDATQKKLERQDLGFPLRENTAEEVRADYTLKYLKFFRN